MSSWLSVGLTVAGAAIAVAVLYWLLILTEGAYLGERAVVWLYDLYAGRYDRIKDWEIADEIFYLADPFVAALGAQRRPALILDVAAGTGRMARAVEAADLLPDARWVLLDASANMLAQARKLVHLPGRAHFLHCRAYPLPFPDDTFDAVVCLEAMEFMRRRDAVLAELVRVLRSGGLLLITNRIGMGVRWMPGRAWTHEELYRLHKQLGQRHVSIRTFLVDYEWVSSVKAGSYSPPGRANDADTLVLLEDLTDLV